MNGLGRKGVLAALRRERSGSVPVGAVTQSASLSQMEALNARWPEAHFDARLMALLADGARTLLGFDLVRVPFDQTIEAELLGAGVDYGDATSNCSLRSHPLRIGDPAPAAADFASGRAKTVCEAIGMLKQRAGDDAAVVGGLVGPFTLVCQLAGASAVLMDALRRPEAVRALLDFATEAASDYARRQVEAGADAICIEDMSASLDLTSPAIYRKLILPAQQRLIAAAGVPVILHVCGANTKILDLLVETGAAALSLEDRTDLAAAVRMGKCAVAGGVAPVEVLLQGTSEDVHRSSLASLEAGVHILAPGCGVPPLAPEENLRELARVARR